LTIAVSVTVLGSLVAIFLVWKGQRAYDPAFDTKVANPTYKTGGPVVLYDEGHLNTHSASGAYKPLAGLIRSDGYELRVSRQVFSLQALAGVSVLIVALARGANDANDNPAFTESEIATIDQWVRNGGSLLLVTDHWPYGPAAAALAQRFDVQMGKGLVEDPVQHDPSRGDSHLVFSEDNGLLRDHPIVHGRAPAERVRKVLTFTGQSLLGPRSAVPFLALSDTAVELPPTVPKVEKSGGDVRVSMEYGAPVSAKGKAQGIALEVERGRVVVLGEAGMLRAQRERGGERVGMNVPGYDDRQLAINIMHWLSRNL
jgi:hypothetical protein